MHFNNKIPLYHFRGGASELHCIIELLPVLFKCNQLVFKNDNHHFLMLPPLDSPTERHKIHLSQMTDLFLCSAS